MLSDKIKQKARYGILERLKQKGMPASPVPEAIAPEQMLPEEEQETLNDMGLVPSLKVRLRKKKPRTDESEALEPQNVTGGY